MTGTWWVATGEIISLSEQQIVDCSWDYQVNGCWGGNGEPALSFIADFGGSASEEAYPYLVSFTDQIYLVFLRTLNLD